MPRTFSRSFDLLFLLLMLSVLVLPGCGSKEDVKTGEEASAKTGEENPSSQSAEVDDHEQQLRADLDDAIALLEKGDLAAFIERYVPFESLEQIRETSSIEEIAAREKEAMQKEFLPKLKSFQGGEIEFLDEDKSKATIKPKAANADEPDDLTAPDLSVADPAEQKIPSYVGFKGDVQEAIIQAYQALEAGDHKTFVENFFPESVLAEATSQEGLETLAVRLKEHPEMASKMIADLRALAALKPEMDAQDTTATFQLNPTTPEARTIRLEKRGTWRLADSAKEIRAEMHKQSKQMLQPLKTETPAGDTLEWVRIRDHWRLHDIR